MNESATLLPDSVARAFGGSRKPVESRPLGNGLIHRTVLARYETATGPLPLVHQRINTDVFREPARLMENLERITRHLREATPATAHSRFLQLRPTIRGELIHRDQAGDLWRSFVYLEETRSLDSVSRIDQAREAAHAFGRFAAILADLPAPPLHETIPRFHDMRGRIEALDSAIASDPLRRVPAATRELAELRKLLDRQEAVFGPADWANLPRRIAHHDCKLNNVLFDASATHAVCVVDLDTVMPGTLLSDFGELVRSAAATRTDPSRDPEHVKLDLDAYAAIAVGYMAGAGELLSGLEKRAMHFAPPLLTLMNAVRFMTDHLRGDTYFRIDSPGQNLERVHDQALLAGRLLDQLDEAREIIASAENESVR